MSNENHLNNEKNSTNKTQQDLSVLESKITLKKAILWAFEHKVIDKRAYKYLIHYNGLNNIRIRKNNKQNKQ